MFDPCGKMLGMRHPRLTELAQEFFSKVDKAGTNW